MGQRSEDTSSAPGTFRERASSLPRPLRDLLELVSVLGHVSASCLVGSGETDGGTLDLAVREHLLRLVDDELSVEQPLLGAASVDMLDVEDRRALHGRAAALPIDPIQRAHHADRAHPPGPAEELAASLTAAARRSSMIGDSSTAARLAGRALSRTTPRSAGWSRRVLDAADAEFAAGHLAEVVTLLDEMDPTELTVEQLDIGVDLMSDAMLRVHGRTWVLERARRLQDQLPVGSPRWDIVEVTRLGFADTATVDTIAGLSAMQDRMDATVSPRAVHAARAWQMVHHLDRGDGLQAALLEQQRDLESTMQPGSVRADASDTEGSLAYQCDDLARSVWRLPQTVRHARAVGDVNRLAASLGHSVVVAVLSGALRTAQHLRDEAEDAALSLVHPPAALHHARGLLALARNDREGLAALLDSDPPPAAEAHGDLFAAGLRGLDAARSHDWSTALPLLDRVHHDAESRGIREPGRRLWVDAELGCALVHEGHLDRAQEIAAALARFGDRPGRLHARGQARRLEGLIASRKGDPSSASTSYDQALADLRGSGFLLQQLRVETERLQVLAALGRAGELRRAHEAASVLADTVGDPRIVDDLALMDPTVTDNGVRSLLTPAEGRVAEAVADGQSNRDIAAAFFLSVRTVEAQLTSIYRKTGARTRTQLALLVLADDGVRRVTTAR
jgi:DNA-binding CsgD family transcriptional regulator